MFICFAVLHEWKHLFSKWKTMCLFFFFLVLIQNSNLPTVCSLLKSIHRKLKMSLKLWLSNFQIWKEGFLFASELFGRARNLLKQAGNQSCLIAFLAVSFWLSLLQTSLPGGRSQVRTLRRLRGRHGDWRYGDWRQARVGTGRNSELGKLLPTQGGLNHTHSCLSLVHSKS